MPAPSVQPEGPIRILLVEDSPEDAALIQRALDKDELRVEIHRVEDENGLCKALDAQSWHVVVSDFHLPHYDGLRALACVRQRDRHVPFVFVSGVLGEERALLAMRGGAQDFVSKDSLSRLPVVVAREARSALRRQAGNEREQQLREGLDDERGYSKAIVQTVRHPLVVLDENDRIVTANRAFCELMSEEAAQCMGRCLWKLDGGGWDTAELRAALKRARERDTAARDLKLMLDFGAAGMRALRVNVEPIEHEGSAAMVLLAIEDTTERDKLQQQMHAAQRMEAVGRLAGGIAHDFNNLLSIIGTYTAFLLEEADPSSSMREDIDVIRDAARRAASLTQQLLAFSRRQVQQLRVLDVNEVVGEMERMLRRVMGEDIQLRVHLERELHPIQADPVHLEQVLMNLVVNARDAMPHGGTLQIETRNVILDASYEASKPADIPSGPYVQICVSDTGTGITAEDMARLFEPFFSTKGPDQGTGLGLAVVYGAVKQMDGFVWPYSEPGHGTTFKIYLPRSEDQSVSQPDSMRTSSVVGGTENVLLVEDQRAVRRAAVRILKGAGYQISQAPDGETALKAIRQDPSSVDVVVTDLVMPGMNGLELAEQAATLEPTIKFLYMSGYSEHAALNSSLMGEGAHYLQKPFTRESLLQAVRAVLDS